MPGPLPRPCLDIWLEFCLGILLMKAKRLARHFRIYYNDFFPCRGLSICKGEWILIQRRQYCQNVSSPFWKEACCNRKTFAPAGSTCFPITAFQFLEGACCTETWTGSQKSWLHYKNKWPKIDKVHLVPLPFIWVLQTLMGSSALTQFRFWRLSDSHSLLGALQRKSEYVNVYYLMENPSS